MTNRRANFVNMVDHLADVPQKNIEQEIKLTNQSPYRQNYHIESESGSLGDPNGFSFFNGEYHLFYQWSPLAFSKEPHYTQHGWKHLTSKNLIDWQDQGAGIESDTPLDRYGTYSGSAIPVGEKLFLMYTGNTWTNTESADDWHRVPYQVGAMMDQNYNVQKWPHPLITGPLEGYTGHFRDPKIFAKDGTYYAVLGIQRENLTGTALLVRSNDLQNWQIIGEVKANHDHFGYMWECPDYCELDGCGILAFCPQGLDTEDNRFKNIYQNGYLIGNQMDLATGEFQCGEFHELDKGFDFYAMQTMEDEQGRRILMAWMGLPETVYPTEEYHYTGCMIFPRELTVKNNRICQKPVAEIRDLYEETITFSEEIASGTSKPIPVAKNNSRDLKIMLECSHSKSFILDLFANQDNTKHLRLIFNRKKQTFTVNRARAGQSIAEDFGVERSCQLDLSKPIKVRILQDVSSTEIFLNDGKDVFSMRIFPDKDQNLIFASTNGGACKIEMEINQLRKGL